MKHTTLATIKYAILVMAIALAFSQAIVLGQDEGPKRSLEGAWTATFTPQNCQTGVPIPAAAFQGLLTFHKGGTMSAWLQNSVITVTRSPFHGVWSKEHGHSDYSASFVALQYNLATGAFSATQRSRGTFILSENGNEFTSTGTTTVNFANGNPPVTGCSTSVGTRID